MTTLSLAMIVKNEAETLERVLLAAKTFCDEMIVVDTGSTDETIAIAEALGAKVYRFDWCDDFAAARNVSFSHCTGDWIIWLDADDVVPESEQAKLRQLKENFLSDDLDAVSVEYRLQFSEAGECVRNTHRERLVRRAANPQWAFPVHECLVNLVPERTTTLHHLFIEHRPLEKNTALKATRNIDIAEKLVLTGGDRTPRNLYYYANELQEHGRHKDALHWYKTYLEVASPTWEQYLVYLNMLNCCRVLGQWEDFVQWGLQAICFSPERPEAFNQLGTYYVNTEQWQRAIPFFTAATALTTIPPVGYYFPGDYTWFPYDFLSICYHALGQPQKAIEMGLKALAFNPDEKPRMLQNLHVMLDQFSPPEALLPEQP